MKIGGKDALSTMGWPQQGGAGQGSPGWMGDSAALATIASQLQAGQLNVQDPELVALLSQAGMLQSEGQAGLGQTMPPGFSQLDVFQQGPQPGAAGLSDSSGLGAALAQLLSSVQGTPQGERLVQALQQGMRTAHLTSSPLSGAGLQGGPSRFGGLDVIQQLGGALFGPSSLRPASTPATSSPLGQLPFQPADLLQTIGQAAQRSSQHPLGTAANALITPFSASRGGAAASGQGMGLRTDWPAATAAPSPLRALVPGMDPGVVNRLSPLHVVNPGLQTYRDSQMQLGPSGLQGHGQAGYRFGPAVEAGGTFKHNLATLGFGARAALESKGDIRGNVTLNDQGLRGSVDANAMIGGGGSVAGHVDTPLFQAAGKAGVEAKLFAQGQGDVAIDKNGMALDARAKVGATAAVEAQAAIKTAGVNVGGEELNLNANVKGRAEVTAQAEGRINAAVTVQPPRAVVDIGGKAFAGAKAEVEGTVGLGPFIKATGKAGVWAGAGAEGNIIFGFDDGKLRFGLNGGTAVGYGAGVSGVIEVDVKKMANAAINTGIDAAQRGIKYALNPLAAVEDAGKLVASLPQKAAKAVDTVVRTGESVIKAATKGISSLAKKLFG